MSNAKGTRSTTRHVLDYKKQSLVDAWVRTHYKEQGLDDTKSAENCTKDLQFIVSASHVKYFRELNEIPSNYGRKRLSRQNQDLLELANLVERLTTEVVAMSKDLAAFKLAMKYNSGPTNITSKLLKVEG